MKSQPHGATECRIYRKLCSIGFLRSISGECRTCARFVLKKSLQEKTLQLTQKVVLGRLRCFKISWNVSYRKTYRYVYIFNLQLKNK